MTVLFPEMTLDSTKCTRLEKDLPKAVLSVMLPAVLLSSHLQALCLLTTLARFFFEA